MRSGAFAKLEIPVLPSLPEDGLEGRAPQADPGLWVRLCVVAVTFTFLSCVVGSSGPHPDTEEPCYCWAIYEPASVPTTALSMIDPKMRAASPGMPCSAAPHSIS